MLRLTSEAKQEATIRKAYRHPQKMGPMRPATEAE